MYRTSSWFYLKSTVAAYDERDDGNGYTQLPHTTQNPPPVTKVKTLSYFTVSASQVCCCSKFSHDCRPSAFYVWLLHFMYWLEVGELLVRPYNHVHENFLFVIICCLTKYRNMQLFSRNLIMFGAWLQDFLTMSTGKRKYDEIASSGYYIPQRDGAGDVELCSSASEVCDDKVSVFRI